MSTVIVPSDDRWSAPKAIDQALPAPAEQVLEQSGCGESYPVDGRGIQDVIRLSSNTGNSVSTLSFTGTAVTIYGYARTNATDVLQAAHYTLDAPTATARGAQYIPVKLPASAYDVCDPVLLRLTGLWAEQSHVLELNVATGPSWAEPMATDIVIFNATVEDDRGRITSTPISRTATSTTPEHTTPLYSASAVASIDGSQPSSSTTAADQTSNGHKPQKTLVLVGPGLIVILIITFTVRRLIRRRRNLQAVNAASEIIKPYGMSPGDAYDVESAHPRRTADLSTKLVALKEVLPSVSDSMSAHSGRDALSPISHVATVGVDERLRDGDGIAPVYDADIHVALDDAVRRAGFSMGALLASLQRVHNNGAETDVESAVPPTYDGASR